ncbi:F-box/WD repeat-containing protein 4-like [Orussus abietinus]|uniref:F-box/WD repeat-containing protein 4-like n=1 Tax=Orussus abietinus TaxID=222816 RepID=UPI00062681CC|nr:F-box/WD repeat-containing protein 4-like [Orussus abietinus]
MRGRWSRGKMTDGWRLDTLPSDVLILIFDYCHAFDLVRLSEVCTRFHEIIKDDTLWIKRSKKPIATNQVSKRFRERCNPLLCLHTKWHVTQNWQNGKYERKILLSKKTKLMPWMQLTSSTLWWSGGPEIRGYRRSDPFNKSNVVFSVKHTNDVCKFIVKDDNVYCGSRDGGLQVWNRDQCCTLNIENAHNGDVHALDVTSSYSIVSGSRDGTVKIWNTTLIDVESTPPPTLHMLDRVWSLAVEPTGTKFAVGLSGVNDRIPLRIYDMECFSEPNVLVHNWRLGAGILDMVWDDPNTLLTCGYDSYTRKWDLRTASCVNIWPDPTNASIYCISSDHHNAVITGAQVNAKAVLWDQRQTKYVQVYFLSKRCMSGPVYSLSFDSCHLYGAMDQSLVELKFSGYSYTENNYNEILKFLTD